MITTFCGGEADGYTTGYPATDQEEYRADYAEPHMSDV